MTGPDFKTAIAALGLNQEGAAKFLCVTLRTINGYANGAPIPEGTAILLRLMVKLNLKPTRVK